MQSHHQMTCGEVSLLHVKLSSRIIINMKTNFAETESQKSCLLLPLQRDLTGEMQNVLRDNCVKSFCVC